MAIDTDRLTSLRQAKVRALARDHLGLADLDVAVFPDGAVAWRGATALIYRADRAAACAGAVVLWAIRRGASAVHVAVDDLDAAPALARRIKALLPDASIWGVAAAGLQQIVPSPLGDTPTSPAVEPPAIEGTDLVNEAGIVRVEVLGLEVARFVDDDAGGQRLAVGIGRFDREAGDLMHAGRDPVSALAGVVAQVRAARHAGAAPHPLNRLCRERWLRAAAVAAPSTVGCARLSPVDPARVRSNLRDPSAAPAVGTGLDGEETLVMCAVGVDPEAVVDAAELLGRHRVDRVVLAVPEIDSVAAYETLLDALPVPASMVAVSTPWPR